MTLDAGEDAAFRVAVVAVHGVSDLEAGSSARAVANLLLEQPSWGQAEEVLLAIELPPLPVPQSPVSQSKNDARKDTRVDERSRQFHDALASSQHESGRDPSLDFQEGLLEDYTSQSEQTYRTPRISLRCGRAGEPRIAVDVLEFYWADLSRAGQGFLRFLGELYQLLVHLPSLGRHALDAEAIRQGNKNKEWRRFAERQAWLIRVLTLGIVLLNLLMIPPAAAIASSGLPEAWRVPVLAFLSAVGGGAVVAFRRLRGGWRRGLLEVVAGLGGGALAAWGLTHWLGGENAVAIAAAAVAALAALVVADSYVRVRPGAFRGAAAGLLSVGLAGLGLAVAGIEGGNAVRISVQFVTILFTGLRITWFLLFLLGSAQIASALLLQKGPNRDADGSGGSIWTARFSLSLAAWAFLVVTLLLWAVATRAVAPFLPTSHVDPWDMKFSVAGRLVELLPDTLTADQSLRDFVKYLITASGGYTFTGALVLLFLFLAALGVGLAPSIRDEIRPPPSNASVDFKAQEGRTTTGLEIAFKGAELLSIGFALAIVSSICVTFGGLSSGVETLQWSAGGFLLTLFMGRRGLGDARVILDVVLDIDNYMREHPRGAAPRVRMFERIHALMRHLGAGGRTEPRAYDAVVFVAHSQGSVIVADFLRLATAKGWLKGTGPSLHLLTMGCPLRQLYHRTFPALYAWTASIGKTLPEFRVASWINLYRAGDYIGRELPLQDGGTAACNVEVGVGAHTHYWDKTATTVGRTLDCTIRGLVPAAADNKRGADSLRQLPGT